MTCTSQRTTKRQLNLLFPGFAASAAAPRALLEHFGSRPALTHSHPVTQPKPCHSPKNYSANFFCSTAWLITTATSRPTAFITVTRRCAGALIRKSSFEYNSSFDGIVASAATSFAETTLPSTTPPLTLICSALSATYLPIAFASATGSPVV